MITTTKKTKNNFDTFYSIMKNRAKGYELFFILIADSYSAFNYKRAKGQIHEDKMFQKNIRELSEEYGFNYKGTVQKTWINKMRKEGWTINALGKNGVFEFEYNGIEETPTILVVEEVNEEVENTPFINIEKVEEDSNIKIIHNVLSENGYKMSYENVKGKLDKELKTSKICDDTIKLLFKYNLIDVFKEYALKEYSFKYTDKILDMLIGVI